MHPGPFFSVTSGSGLQQLFEDTWVCSLPKHVGKDELTGRNKWNIESVKKWAGCFFWYCRIVEKKKKKKSFTCSLTNAKVLCSFYSQEYEHINVTSHVPVFLQILRTGFFTVKFIVNAENVCHSRQHWQPNTWPQLKWTQDLPTQCDQSPVMVITFISRFILKTIKHFQHWKLQWDLFLSMT